MPKPALKRRYDFAVEHMLRAAAKARRGTAKVKAGKSGKTSGRKAKADRRAA